MLGEVGVCMHFGLGLLDYLLLLIWIELRDRMIRFL